mgnify:CR=1 FL=1
MKKTTFFGILGCFHLCLAVYINCFSILLLISLLGIYSDGIISVFVIIGFPITNWEDIIYDLFCLLSILTIPSLYILTKEA